MLFAVCLLSLALAGLLTYIMCQNAARRWERLRHQDTRCDVQVLQSRLQKAQEQLAAQQAEATRERQQFRDERDRMRRDQDLLRRLQDYLRNEHDLTEAELADILAGTE